jgi:hypothetical protein
MSVAFEQWIDVGEYLRLKHARRVETISRLLVGAGALVYATGFLIVIVFMGRMGVRDFGDLFRMK